MGLIGSLIGKVTGGAASDIIKAGGGVLDNLFTSDEERMEAERLAAEIQQRPTAAQWETNKIEAGHRSIWVAGWRPAIGWVCAASLASYYIPQFIMGSVLWSIQCWQTGHVVAYPLSIEGLMGLVSSLLGLGAMRTYEKVKGAAK